VVVEEDEESIEIEEWVDEKEDDKDEVAVLVIIGGFVNGFIDMIAA
jgi:hypothetical protein